MSLILAKMIQAPQTKQMNKTHLLHQDFASPPVLRALQDHLLDHPLVGPSPLKGTFYETRGFAIVFTTAGIKEVQDRFACLTPFVEEIVKPHLTAGGWPGLRSKHVHCNAFYLNLLMVPAGTWVRRHVDATLRRTGDLEDVLPTRVSVLWIRTPKELSGGELQIFAQDQQLATITPREGNLLHFRGDLGHGIAPVVLDATPSPETKDLMRVSLVCEQYALSEPQLELFEPYRLHSRAGFSAFLQDASDRSSRSV